MRVNKDTSQGTLLRAEIVDYNDAPSECTLYPDDVSEAQRATTWITARGDAFCSLNSRE